ncbi:hypothetical protein FQN54_003811 [Arachnomyces sp. PD_36]|nr:hypothetical protein FQN54_003811 [Arachnomyces sp. PD_36]
MKIERSEQLLSRVIEAGYSYACAADDCLAIFFKSEELTEHLRNGRNQCHKRFAEYLNRSICSKCGEMTDCALHHDYLWHPKSYELKMRELLPYDVPTQPSIPRFSLCFDIERVFRSGSNRNSYAQNAEREVSKLCDVIESLHKRLVIMENKFRDSSEDDFLYRAFGGPICDLKDLRHSLKEQQSNILQCPASDCQQAFSSSQSRNDHVKASCDDRHLFYKSSFDDKYCFQCGEEFHSLNALIAHSQKAHGKTTSSLDTFRQTYSQVACETSSLSKPGTNKLTVVASSQKFLEPVNNSSNGAQAGHTLSESASTPRPVKRKSHNIRFKQRKVGGRSQLAEQLNQPPAALIHDYHRSIDPSMPAEMSTDKDAQINAFYESPQRFPTANECNLPMDPDKFFQSLHTFDPLLGGHGSQAAEPLHYQHFESLQHFASLEDECSLPLASSHNDAVL